MRTSALGRLCLCLAIAALAPFCPTASAADLKARAQRLAETLDAQREEQHIPGMAVAVVKDGEVILARGFGLADLESERPVTEDTIFAIGSTTKAFTATLIGMLVDEGAMSWDDPAEEYLPYFTLDVEADDESARPTIRDLLSHRTGFARMSLLWAGGLAEPETVLRTAANAEPVDDFRESFHYNNVMYLAAGVAAEKAAGSDWHALMRERILEPLGMKDATTSVRAAQKNANLALGYLWNADEKRHERQKMRHLDSIAPAGAINASITDMTRWLRFLLADGVVDGRRLVSEQALSEIYSSEVELAPGVDYGLGWFIREWNGRTVYEHGGNIDGFAAQVALLPEENLGFVLLANISATPLQQGAMGVVWEALVDDDESPDADTDAEAEPGLDEYTGEYVADFPPFDGRALEVLEQEDGLAVDVPDQQVFKLGAPNKSGRRPILGGPPASVSFQRSADGEVVSMTLHQGGFDMEMPKKGVEIAAEIPLEKLQEYLGAYHFEQMGQDFEVLIKNKRLAVDVPGQMAYELHPPDEEGRWVFRVTDQIEVAFNRDEAGEIESMTLFQSGQEMTMPRVEEEEADDSLPTIEEVHELRRTDRRAAALAALGCFHMSGEAYAPSSGITGSNDWWIHGHSRFRQRLDFGDFGYIETILNEGDAATVTNITASEIHTGKDALRQTLGNPSGVLADWRRFFEEQSVEGRAEVEGVPALRLRLSRADLEPVVMFIDAENGDVLRTQMSVPIAAGMGSITVVTTYSDYREVEGLRIPHRIRVENQMTGATEVRLDSFEKLDDPPADLFAMPDPDELE